MAIDDLQRNYPATISSADFIATYRAIFAANALFIPADKVLGRFDLFVSYYKPFCDEQLLEVLSRIEKYSQELDNPILNTNILEQNHVKYSIADPTFSLPSPENINQAMLEQMARITPAQYEVLNMLSCIDKEEDVAALKTVIVQFLNTRLQNEIERLWNNGTLTDETISAWSHEHMRTP